MPRENRNKAPSRGVPSSFSSCSMEGEAIRLRYPFMKSPIQTKDAPAAIGTYSQAVRAGDTVYVSGQIGFDPASMQLAEGIDAQIHRVFGNLAAIAAAAGLGL